MLVGLQLFPATLLHGDVYGLNVLVPSDGQAPRLVDWGSARIGPAMLDVALGAGSAGFAAYVRTREGLAGKPLEPSLVEAEHAWATRSAMRCSSARWPRDSGPEAAVDQLDQAEVAWERFTSLLSRLT